MSLRLIIYYKKYSLHVRGSKVINVLLKYNMLGLKNDRFSANQIEFSIYKDRGSSELLLHKLFDDFLSFWNDVFVLRNFCSWFLTLSELKLVDAIMSI